MTLSIKALIHKIADGIVEIALPQSCINCKIPGDALCRTCGKQACARSFGCVLCNFRNQTGALCRKCKPKGNALSHVICIGLYDGVLKQAVRDLKYRKRRNLAQPLGKLLAQQFMEWSPTENTDTCVAVPIPLHPAKEKTRGFNQAALLAKHFSETTGIAVAQNILAKIKDTEPQARTAVRAERILNIHEAFAADAATCAPYQNKTIILIDDVATTGATLLDASRALAEAGATKIIGLVVAHG